MIFIDTGAFLAKYLTKDQFHASALEKWAKIQEMGLTCVTSNFILNESFTLLGRWASYEFAVEKAHIIYSSNVFEIIRPDFADETAALALFNKYSDQKVSFTDCLSFQLMKKHRVNRVFTFDKHFSLAGFDLIS